MIRGVQTIAVTVLAVTLFPEAARAQATVADYQRAMTLRDRYQDLALNVPEQVQWIRNTNRFWYRHSVPGGHAFVLVDADARTKAAAFDHARLAASLSTAAVGKYTAVTLPFSSFSFVDDDRAIEFRIGPAPGAGRGDAAAGVDGDTWRCTLDSYNCRRPDTESRGGRGRGGRGGGLGGPVRAPFEINGAEPRKSPDGKLEALVNNYNLAIREVGKRALTWLTTDGSEGAYYDPESLAWSPDSTRIAIDKVTPGYRRYVHYVESSPEDQLQPKDSTRQYAKPGDVLDVERPVIVSVADKSVRLVDNALFPNAYDMTRLQWRKNSSAVTFEFAT